MKWYKKVLSNYANFKGRARRKEYWMFNLIYAIFYIAILILDSASGTRIVSVLFRLIHFVPMLAVSVRRMHDINKSGWYLLVNFIPFIGFIWYLVLLCTDGTYGANKYGPDSKRQFNNSANV